MPVDLSKRAAELIHQFITVQGLSYADAIKRCEEIAEVAAKKARAPYDEAADSLRAELNG